MPVQDSFIALGTSLLAVLLWLVLVVLSWFILLILLLGFCVILGAGSGFGAEALVPALIWFVFFCVRLFVWLAW